MKVTVYSALSFERALLEHANAGRHQLQMLDDHLDAKTTALAEGSLAVSVFATDDVSAPILEQL